MKPLSSHILSSVSIARPLDHLRRTVAARHSLLVAGLRTVTAVSPPNDLKAHAITAIQEAREQIVGSSNLTLIRTDRAPAESDRLVLPGLKDNFNRSTDMEEWQLLRKRALFVRKHVGWLTKYYQCDAFELPASARLRKIFMAEQLNKICPYGNCSALAETTFLSLYRKSLFPLELIYQFSHREGKDYSHAFVVMNRKEESELKSTEQWCDQSLIVDAWVPAVFYADQFDAMRTWLPGTFDMNKVYSVIRLETRLENAERPAVEIRSEKDFETEKTES